MELIRFRQKKKVASRAKMALVKNRFYSGQDAIPGGMTLTH